MGNEAPSHTFGFGNPHSAFRDPRSAIRNMKIRVTCPACHDTLEVDDEHVGRQVECGSCLQPFTVEDPAAKRPKKYKMRRSESADADGREEQPAAKPAWAKGRSRRRDEDDDRDEDDYERRPRRRSRDEDDEYEPRRSRLIYILLGIFLGSLGIHNFYAGRTAPGVAQLLITLVVTPVVFCAGFFVFVIGAAVAAIPYFGVYVWVLVEIVTVDRDGSGRRME